jgi:squalene-hopene/tetraprenyl-beta-curcumene cyclase
VNFISPLRHGAFPNSVPADLDERIDSAIDALLAERRSDGHWCFELEADATIPSEYILLRQFLAEPDDRELEEKIARYLRRTQASHGGWCLYHGGGFDISASVKAYFALKMIGDGIDEPHMVRAREGILARGGAGAANVFTRFSSRSTGKSAGTRCPACRSS